MIHHPVAYDDIADACKRLLARGQRPSLRLVRHEIGRGSMTTIHEHLGRWTAEQQAIQAPTHEAIRALETLAPSALPALREAFRTEVAEELRKAQEEARDQRQLAADLRDELQESERQRSDLLDRVAAIELRIQAVDVLADRVAALTPEMAGRLDAHTDHLLAAADAHAQQAASDRRQAAGDMLQVATSIQETLRAQREQQDGLRLLDAEIRHQGHAVYDRIDRLRVALADAVQSADQHARMTDARIDRLFSKQGLLESLLRTSAASARRSAGAR